MIWGEPEPFEIAWTISPCKSSKFLVFLPPVLSQLSKKRSVDKKIPQDTLSHCKQIFIRTVRYFCCKHLKRAARHTIEKVFWSRRCSRNTGKEGTHSLSRHFYCFSDPTVSHEKLLALFYELHLILLSNTNNRPCETVGEAGYEGFSNFHE